MLGHVEPYTASIARNFCLRQFLAQKSINTNLLHRKHNKPPYIYAPLMRVAWHIDVEAKFGGVIFQQ